eukprot:2574311-Amphidinium_carterae.1
MFAVMLALLYSRQLPVCVSRQSWAGMLYKQGIFVDESSPCGVYMPHTGSAHCRGVCAPPLLSALLDMLALTVMGVWSGCGLPWSLTDGWCGWPLLTPTRKTVTICVACYLVMLLTAMALEVFETAEHQWTAGQECGPLPYGPERWAD